MYPVIEFRRLLALVAVAILSILMVLALSCSKSSSPTESQTPQAPQPNPNGVLLTGDTATLAVDAITALPPSPAADGDIQDDGFLMTRLTAVVSPRATVGLVNTVMQGHGVTIVCMLQNAPLVTLKTPTLADSVAADSLSGVLQSSGAFSLVVPAYIVRDEPDTTTGTPGPNLRVAPGGSADNEMIHLTVMHMPAAWNVKDLIATSTKVKVLVPDAYAQLLPHSELPSQTFVSAGSVSTETHKGEIVGNHGFHACGIIGATFDSLGATGVHPSAAQHLDILSLPIGGFTFGDMSASLAIEIANHLPTGKFVLNTSLGYNDTGFVRYPKLLRAYEMISWRAWVAKAQNRFLHAAAAGNDGAGSGDSRLASFNSPWNSAARFQTVRDMLTGVSLSPTDSAALDQTVSKALAIVPEAAAPLHNVVIVGNNDASGVEDPSSSKDPDVSCDGQLVFSTCVQTDPGYPAGLDFGCKGTDGWYSGTSMAAPQVAGLSAYMWSLQPSLAVSDLRDIILRSNQYNQLDGYAAIQALDLSLSNAPMRRKLLDVASAGAVEGPDGVFNEDDIALFLGKFHDFEQARGGTTFTPDYSRYDLNGDGMTGDRLLADGIFDLDVNNPQAFGVETQMVCGSLESFDEMNLTDYDILTYYAFSPLYQGDTSQRDTLLGCGTTPQIIYTFDSDLEGWGAGVGTCCASNQVYWADIDWMPGVGGVAALDGSDAGNLDTLPNSWISKSIAIPAVATTLRFLTSPHNRDGANGALRVRLVSGGVSHTLLEWETLIGVETFLVFVPRQADISAFAGQTVTIFFEQRDSGGRVNQQRYIDNVLIQ